MLIVEYRHTLDLKKRLSLPAKFRKELGRRVVVTRGLDTCLFLFSERAWRSIAKKLGELPVGEGSARGMARFMLAGASEVEIDMAGRILIPDYLKEFASLRSEVVLAGLSQRVEIWDEKKWREYKRNMEKDAPRMAQTLGDLGIL
jgi:MraZ protein